MKETNFKDTEIGRIPEDWEVKTLGDCVKVVDGTHQTPRYVTTGGVPFYSVENLTANDFVNTKHISLEEHKFLTRTNKIKKGDILMTRIGSIGNCRYIDWDVFASFYVSLALLKDKSGLVDMRFLAFASKSKAFQDSILAHSLQFAIPLKINLGEISNVQFAMPANKTEQTNIAQALSSIDQLIEDLNQLIEKKKAIKQGAMQSLFTGKKRLAGFSEPWKSVLLGEVANIKTGKKNGNEAVENGKYPFFVRSQQVYRINSYSFDGEAILVPGEGGIGDIFHYINGKFDYHQRVYKISDFEDGYDVRFIYYYMKRYFGLYAKSQSVKATVDSLRLPTFENFEMFVPSSKKEQIAIASLLASMDIEYDEILARRDKYVAIKQGMMQQLLTGKIRLV